MEPGRGYTTWLKEEIARACRGFRSLTDVTSGYPLSWHQVKTIDEWYVRTQRPPIDWGNIECIGMDEFSLKKGHEYATRVVDLTDPKRAQTIWVGRHRRSATAETFYEWMPTRDSIQLEAVCVDEWGPYKTGTKQYAPQAQIVKDPFPLIQRMNKVMGSVRTRLKRNGDEETQKILRGTKQLLEQAEKNRSEADDDARVSSFEVVPQMGTIHRLKEQLRCLGDQPDRPAESISTTD